MKYKVLVVDDEESIRQSLKDILEDEDYKVYLAKNRLECIELIKNFYFPVIFLDLWLPDSNDLNLLEEILSISPNSKVIVITGHANIELAINSIKKGAFDFLEKPLSLDKTLISLKKALEENINERLKMISSDYLFIGNSPKISSLKETAAKIAKTDVPIVIYGESGTGKELLARMIHSLSDRKDKPFVDINCAAIPDELIESELFGYEKGAFTGAFSRKLGKLEIANLGTLFLDEIGDLSLKAQAKLLRALETKSFTRLGGTQNIEVDIRVICASNKNLKEEISKGSFREDLFYRLSVFTVEIPPLRERGTDILDISNFFLEKFCLEKKVPLKKFSTEAQDILLSYSWPGNVRELKNVIERLVIMVDDKEIRREHLEFLVDPSIDMYAKIDNLKEAKALFEKSFIERKLVKYNYNLRELSKAMGIDISNLYRKIKAYNITIKENLDSN